MTLKKLEKPKILTAIRLTPEVRRGVHAIAIKEKRTFSMQVEYICQEYIDTQRKKDTDNGR